MNRAQERCGQNARFVGQNVENEDPDRGRATTDRSHSGAEPASAGGKSVRIGPIAVDRGRSAIAHERTQGHFPERLALQWPAQA
jgi:hypothetical protein